MQVTADSQTMRVSRKRNRAVPFCTLLTVIVFSLLLVDRKMVTRSFRRLVPNNPSDKNGENDSSTRTGFFVDKQVMFYGVFPLPKRRQYNSTRPDNSTIPSRFYRKKPGVSAHNFRWITNPRDTCLPRTSNARDKKTDNIFLLVAIASASWEFERRDLIRQTWASVTEPLGKNVKYVFFVGNDNNEENRRKIEQEFKKHMDIVMEDFEETYKNLTVKTQGQLKWITYFCPNARYVMHVDDDVFVDVRGIVSHLLNEDTARLMRCAKVFKPIVRRDGKWETSKKEYPKKQYPLSCVGWCFVMSQDVANDLYYMSLDTFLIHLEDVTFTGILRERIGNLKLAKMSNGESLCQHKGWPKDRPTNDKLADAWKKLQKS